MNSRKLTPKDSPWYCEDIPDETKPLVFLRATESRKSTDAELFKFSSLVKLKGGLPQEVSAVEVEFEEFADRPLGRPYAYLQVSKNGACFYNCLSLALEGHTGSNEVVRKVICDEMMQYPDRFEAISGFPQQPGYT